jgi:hypothetical protein
MQELSAATKSRFSSLLSRSLEWWQSRPWCPRLPMPVPDHMRLRLAEESNKKPCLQHWPESLEIEGGTGMVSEKTNPNPDPRLASLEAIEKASLAEKPVRILAVQSHGEASAAERQLKKIGEEEAALNQKLPEAESTLRKLEDERDTAIRTHALPASSSSAAAYPSSAPPAMPGCWPLVWRNVLIFIGILSEAYTLALPWWFSNGVDCSRLAREWAHQPIMLIAGAGFAFSATAILFIGWSWVVERLYALHAAHSRIVAVLMKATGILLGLALLLATSLGIAQMRARLGTDAMAAASAQTVADLLATSPPAGDTAGGLMDVFFLLTVLLPLGCAIIHHQAHNIQTERKALRQELRAWDYDRMRAGTLAKEAVVHFNAPIETAQKRLQAITERIKALDAERAAIEQRAVTVEKAIRAQVTREHETARNWNNHVNAKLAKSRRKAVVLVPKTGPRQVPVRQQDLDENDRPSPSMAGALTVAH